MDWYFAALKKYSRFRGRARRKEYWLFNLFNSLIIITLLIAYYSLSFFALYNSHLLPFHLLPLLYWFFNLIYLVYILGTIIPSFAVLVRRLHDTGKSGWWYFILLIPIVGFVALLVSLCEDSQPGTNQYGANPK